MLSCPPPLGPLINCLALIGIFCLCLIHRGSCVRGGGGGGAQRSGAPAYTQPSLQFSSIRGPSLFFHFDEKYVVGGGMPHASGARRC